MSRQAAHILCRHRVATDRVPADKPSAALQRGRCRYALPAVAPTAVGGQSLGTRIQGKRISVLVDSRAPRCGLCRAAAPAHAQAAAALESAARVITWTSAAGGKGSRRRRRRLKVQHGRGTSWRANRRGLPRRAATTTIPSSKPISSLFRQAIRRDGYPRMSALLCPSGLSQPPGDRTSRPRSDPERILCNVCAPDGKVRMRPGRHDGARARRHDRPARPALGEAEGPVRSAASNRDPRAAARGWRSTNGAGCQSGKRALDGDRFHGL